MGYFCNLEKLITFISIFLWNLVLWLRQDELIGVARFFILFCISLKIPWDKHLCFMNISSFQNIIQILSNSPPCVRPLFPAGLWHRGHPLPQAEMVGLVLWRELDRLPVKHFGRAVASCALGETSHWAVARTLPLSLWWTHRALLPTGLCLGSSPGAVKVWKLDTASVHRRNTGL